MLMTILVGLNLLLVGTVCSLIFVCLITVRGFCGFTSHPRKFRPRKFRRIRARYKGRPSDDVTYRKMALTVFIAGKLHSLDSPVLLLSCALFLLDVEYVFLLYVSPNAAACLIWRLFQTELHRRRLFLTRWQQLREKPLERGKELEGTVRG